MADEKPMARSIFPDQEPPDPDEVGQEEAPEQEAPEEAPQEEPGEEEGKEGGEEDRRHIPYEAYADERGKRQRLEQEMTSLRERSDEMLRHILSQQRQQHAPEQAGQAEEPAGPSYDDDPAGYLRREVDDLKAARAQLEQQHRQQAAMQDFLGQISAAEARFKQETPDYDEVLAGYAQKRVRDLTSAGFSPQQAMQKFQWEQIELAQQAAMAHRDPAATAYQIARSSAPPPSVEPQQAAPDPEVRKERRMSGMQQAKTIAKAGQRPNGGGAITSEDLARMTPRQWDQFKRTWSAANPGVEPTIENIDLSLPG